MMEPVQVVTAFQQAFHTQDVERIMALMTADCVFEDTTAPDGARHEGQDAVRDQWERLFRQASRASFETEEIITAENRVVVCWRYSWGDSHVRGLDLFRVRDELVAEKRSYAKG